MFQNNAEANRSTGVGPYPMVKRANLKQIEDAKAVEAKPAEVEIPASVLAGHIRRAWARNKLAKERVALDLLRCLRARRGMYSQDEINQMSQTGGLNFVWVDLTETKCRAASAWIREVLFPPGDVPFQVQPSPMPDLPVEYKRALTAKAMKQAQETMLQAAQAGGETMSRDEFVSLASDIGDKLRDQTQKQYERKAKGAAARMQKQIEDNMAEGGWNQSLDEFIEDFVTYPAAMIEGPVFGHEKQLQWLPGWKLGVKNNKIQKWTRRSPFDVFPAPYATDCQRGDLIIRLRYRRDELFDCIGLEHFKEDAIRQALEDYTNGHMEAWLWTESERQRLEQYTYYSWLSPAGVIDALWFWGGVPGWKLMQWQVEGWDSLDPDRDYEVDAILIGPYVIRCAINSDPLGRRPFFKACFDAIPGAFWGRSVPDLASSCQKMVNASASALADNLGAASGPMAWVHNDRLADGESSTDIYPWRVWQLKSDPTQGTNPGVGFWQANDNSEKLVSLIERWETKADDATGIPRYTYGNERVGGAASTLGGLSLLMNNAAKGLRRAISNVDFGVIEPSVTRSYVYNMLYNPDQSIKADCFVAPQGALCLLIKETQSQARLQMLQTTNNPVDMEIIGVEGRAKLMRETFKALDVPLDGIVPTDEELKTRMEEQRAAQEQEAAMLQQQQQEVLAMKAAEDKGKADLEREKMDREDKREGMRAAAQLQAAKMRSGGGEKKVVFDYDEGGNIRGAVTQ
jgi:hypothetical protein